MSATPMLKAIDAALKAAEKYEVVNEGDRSEAAFVVALLGDVRRHAAQLDELAANYERGQRLRDAQAELIAAQSA